MTDGERFERLREIGAGERGILSENTKEIIGGIATIFLWIFFIVVIVGGIIWLGYGWYVGALPTLYEKYIKEPVGETPVEKEAKSAFEWLRDILTFKVVTEEQLGWKSKTTKQTEQKNLGVIIKEFEAPSNFYIGEDIEISGLISGETLEGTTTINLRCTSDDEKIKGVAVPQKIELLNGLQEEISCRFKGESIKAEKEIESLIAKLTADYEFSVESDWVINAVTKEEFDRIKNENLKKYSTTSESTKSPVNLGIGSKTSQPFIAGGEYIFGITLTNEEDGKVKELKKVELELPEQASLATDDEFCNFEETSEKTYTVKESLLKRDFEKYARENAITFKCKFKLGEVEEGPATKFIFKSKVEFIYEIEKTETVVLLKLEKEKTELKEEKTAEELYNEAINLLKEEDYTGVINKFREVVQTNDQEFASRAQYGICSVYYNQIKDNTKAEPECQKTIDNYPGSEWEEKAQQILGEIK